ncbi:hypothetical protein Zmor_010043 [Zophobas morio]|uniref:Uncharacterized protein n=1 Tax=Zophobas morio TaxID=2755281 RepID=A0AA38MIJ5_9CUCU|nr:hypothetical protein Zmor_010043 [Zophobas morio]
MPADSEESKGIEMMRCTGEVMLQKGGGFQMGVSELLAGRLMKGDDCKFTPFYNAGRMRKGWEDFTNDEMNWKCIHVDDNSSDKSAVGSRSNRT